MKRTTLSSLILACCLLALLPGLAAADPPPAHQYIQEYEGPQTCEKCHLGQVDQVMHSVHYTWAEKMDHYSPIPATIARINWLGILNPDMQIPGGCARCHIGGGILPGTPAAETPEARERVDCLICHAEVYDMTARYPQQDEEGNWVIPGDRSLAAARTAARPTDEACLRCHLNAGGGELLKRGVDFAPVADRHSPESYGDVHAERGMVCVDCHRAPEHKIYGFAPTLWSRDRPDERLTCAACHTPAPHANALLNKHERLDCRTCHVPFTGGLMQRDWTAAPEYDPITELYRPASEVAPPNTVVPSYRWFNGDPLRPGKPWPGMYGDLSAYLQPFKIYQGTVPVNPENGKPWPLKLGVFYKTGDLEKAIAAGAADAGLEYTGAWEAKTLSVPLQISHGVVDGEHALTCTACHVPDGRLDFAALGYGEEQVALLQSLSHPEAGTPQPLQIKFLPNAAPLAENPGGQDIVVDTGWTLPLFGRWSLLGAVLILLILVVAVILLLVRQRRQLLTP